MRINSRSCSALTTELGDRSFNITLRPVNRVGLKDNNLKFNVETCVSTL